METSVTTTPRDLLVNILADAVRSLARVDLRNRVTDNARYEGEHLAYVASAARVVAMLYGGDNEAVYSEAVQGMQELAILHDEPHLTDHADELADEMATLLLETI